MSTVRRLYFYGLALISIEVVVWGVVGLLRTIISSGIIGAGSLLATGLSLVLVGLPIFYLHWRTAQRDALSDPAEHASRIRAVFFYAILSGLIGPLVYAALAVLNRGLVGLFGQSEYSAWFGRNQTPADNLLAIGVNVIVMVYFWRSLKADWKAAPPENSLSDVRRLFRYLWMLVGLVLTVSGAYNLLRYLFYTPGQKTQPVVAILSGGLTFLLVGTPLWAYFWWLVQEAQRDPSERRSLLRLVVLYLVSLAGIIGVLTTAGAVANALIRWFLGEAHTLIDFIQGNSAQLGAGISLAVMWAYYDRVLTREVAALSDQPRRSALRRLYFYILSALGLAIAFAGLIQLIAFLVEFSFSRLNLVGTLKNTLSGALAALLVGLPLWLLTWRVMQEEAARRDDQGDHARRSVLRKSYLYLALFLLVVGGMTFSGQFIFTILNALLSQVSPPNLGQDLVKLALWLVVDVIFLVYHWRALRQDNHLAQQTLGDLHAAFPTLVLVNQGEPFGEIFIQEIRRVAPRIPVALHLIEKGVPDETMLAARMVLMPVGLALDPPEALRLWLDEYHGHRLLIPLEQEGYIWLGTGDKSRQDLARESSRTVRQLAEGESLRQSLPNSPWAVTGYILGAIFGLLLLGGLFSLMINAVFR